MQPPAAAKPPLAPEPALPPPQPLQLSSSSETSPQQAGTGPGSLAGTSSVGTGFGSVLHFGSTQSSRRNSMAPLQAAAAAELAAAEASTGAAAGERSFGGESARLPSPPAAAQPVAAEQAPQEQQEEQGVEGEGSWPCEPATTFQLVSKPLFESSQGGRAGGWGPCTIACIAWPPDRRCLCFGPLHAVWL